jgi:hypothetical protein
MSYEGFTEYLCEDGHLSAKELFESYGATQEEIINHHTCECGKLFKWRWEVDLTNGFLEDYPQTRPGPKKEIGWDDVWHKDHYGNKYATKLHRFKPLTGVMTVYEQEGKKQVPVEWVEVSLPIKE